MSQPVHITFITTANLATNPRLVKEVELALSVKYKVTIVCFSFSNWSMPLNEEIKKKFGNAVHLVEVSAGRKPFLPWLVSTFLQILCSFLVKAGIRSPFILTQALFKRSYLLQRALQNTPGKIDLVIAHNPGSFFSALKFAVKQKAKLGIDVEDYHPGETNDLFVQKLTLCLMKKILPKADYCSYAAPLIAEETKKNIPSLQNRQQVILNGFYSNEFTEPQQAKEDTLQIVWFSQNIDAGRGLENIIRVINKLYPKVRLHLIGALTENFDREYLQNKTGVEVHPPMLQKELHHSLSLFDAGLATDIPINHNRDIALTNKILAYAQAGLYIAAMQTTAQDLFLKESRLEFVQMINSEESIEAALLHLCELKVNGKLDKRKQFTEGQKYSWENISVPLIKIWKS